MACILLVEGDDDTLEAMRAILAEEGFDVRLALDGDGAMTELRKNGVNVVFVDLAEAMRFLDELAGQRDLDRVNAILMSAEMRPISHPRAAAVLRMPFGIDELVALARKYCG